MKNKLKEIYKNSIFFKYFRKLRYLYHLRPHWQNTGKFLKHYFGGLYVRMDQHHLFLFSGGLAFSLFTCIIPLILIVFWILGNFLSSEEMELQIITFINTVIPYSEYADFVKQIIFSRVEEVIEFKNVAGLLGFAGLFFAASGFFSSMRTVLNKINGVDIEVNIFIGKLRDFLVILVAILLFFASILALPLLELFKSIADSTPYLQFFNHPIFQQLFTILVSIFIMLVLMYLFYSFIPTSKIKHRSALVGALWASLFWVGMKVLFGYYLANFQTWGRIYGAYALVIVIAFWIYYTAAVFILGAEIGKLFDERLKEKIAMKKDKLSNIPPIK
ncbi:MAG: YihY/virulence factor BrkB family protein [Ignavibacteriales bacterium]|nr:YihY/virulence factor BrkB family protein [Ignavibacteriales bacterium]